MTNASLNLRVLLDPHFVQCLSCISSMMATSFLIQSFLWAKGNFTSQVLFLSLSLLCKPYSLLRPNLEYESSSELYSRSSFHSLDNHIHFHLLNFHQWYYMPMPTKSLYSSLTHMICLKPTYSNIYSTLPLDAFRKIRNQHGSKMDSFIWTPLLTFLISIRVPQSTMLFKKLSFLFSSSHTILHLINNYVPQSLYDLRFLI